MVVFLRVHRAGERFSRCGWWLRHRPLKLILLSRPSCRHQRSWRSWRQRQSTCRGCPWARGICSRRYRWQSCKFWIPWAAQGRTSQGCPVWENPHLLWRSYTAQNKGISLTRLWVHLLDDSLVDEGRLLLGTTEIVDHVFHGHLCLWVLSKIII